MVKHATGVNETDIFLTFFFFNHMKKKMKISVENLRLVVKGPMSRT